MAGKTRSKNVVLVLVSCVLSFILIDLSFNIASGLYRDHLISNPDKAGFSVYDDYIGWIAAPNKDVRRHLVDSAGHPYEAHVTTDSRGFRRSIPGGNLPLLLVLGDSFTHAIEVGDGKTFYDVLARDLSSWRVAAYGSGGYGNVQQFLMLRRLRTKIPPPQAVLIQLSYNDIVNNSYELEHTSWQNNNLRERPYLNASGMIVLRDPRRWYECLWIGRYLSKRGLVPRGASIEDRVKSSEDEEAAKLYEKAGVDTAAALKRLRSVYSDIPYYFFVVGDPKRDLPFARDLALFAVNAGMTPLRVETDFRERTRVLSILAGDGAHWNEAGHAVMGKLLAERLGDFKASAKGLTNGPDYQQ